jgi:hypothetical protein
MKFLDGFKMLPLQMKYVMNLEQHTFADDDTYYALLRLHTIPQHREMPPL